MLRKLVLGAVALGTALCLSTTASAITIDTNLGAAGGVISGVNTFDWLPGSAYADGGNQAVINALNNAIDGGNRPVVFDTYYHAKLTAATSAGGTVLWNPPAGVEVTVTARFRESVSAAIVAPGIAIATFAFVDLPANDPAEFLEIYYDTTPDSNALAGTGYNDGRLILKTDLTGAASNFGLTDNFTNIPGTTTGTVPYAGAGPDGFFDVGDLDQAGSDDYAGVDSMHGNGVTSLFANVLDFDGLFFKHAPGDLIFDILTTTQVLPFGSVDPSDAYNLAENVAAAGTVTAGGGEVSQAIAAAVAGVGIGRVNGHNSAVTIPGVFVAGGFPFDTGLGGPDIIFQADASNDFSSVRGVIPEPMTATLSLLSLGGLALVSRRRR